MSELNYKKKSGGELLQESSIYHVESAYDNETVRDMFLNLKANFCDLNPALAQEYESSIKMQKSSKLVPDQPSSV
jgi:hypothetical protein